MYRIGRLVGIQPVTSAILKEMSRSVIFSRKAGPFYSIHDWLPKNAWHSCPMTDRMAQVCANQPALSNFCVSTSFIAFNLSTSLLSQFFTSPVQIGAEQPRAPVSHQPQLYSSSFFVHHRSHRSSSLLHYFRPTPRP
jgi:hypothetical protein